MILTVTLNPCVHKYVIYRDEHPERTVVRPVSSRLTSGGKGLNAARVIQRLEGHAEALSTCGGITGELLRRCLEREGVAASLVEVQAPTRMSVCLYDRGKGRFREFLEPGQDSTAGEAEQLRKRFDALLPGAEWVTLNGSSPGTELDPLFAEFCRRAREAGKQVILDSYGKPAPGAERVPPNWIRANRDELEDTYKINLGEGLKSYFKSAQQDGLDGMLISDGPGEITCLSGEGCWRVRPPKVAELNPVGSGDSLTGAFVLALQQGHGLERALQWGAAAGSANAEELLVCEFARERWLELVDRATIERH
jgi:tagatose 6-phosphate kinase